MRCRTTCPFPLTTCIGREAEQVAVQGLVADHRLVTITGAGSAGKTRLTLDVAPATIGTHRAGSWWGSWRRSPSAPRYRAAIATLVQSLVTVLTWRERKVVDERIVAEDPHRGDAFLT